VTKALCQLLVSVNDANLFGENISAVEGDIKVILGCSEAVIYKYTQTKNFMNVCVLLLEFKTVS
jgi:hypothetical protein